MRLLPVVAVAGCLVACAAPAPTPAQSTSARACATADLAVTVAHDLTIRVQNTSATACTLSGQPPVTMLVARTDEPTPADATVMLGLADTFVQPQHATAWNVCSTPISAGLPRSGFWTIRVQGEVVRVPGNGQDIASVVNCMAASLPAGHVEQVATDTPTPATCSTAPVAEFAVAGHAAELLPLGATVTVTAKVGQVITVTFLGDCASGGQLLVNGSGPAAASNYKGVAVNVAVGAWAPTQPGTRKLLVAWACSGPMSCPLATLGYIKVVTPA